MPDFYALAAGGTLVLVLVVVGVALAGSVLAVKDHKARRKWTGEDWENYRKHQDFLKSTNDQGSQEI